MTAIRRTSAMTRAPATTVAPPATSAAAAATAAATKQQALIRRYQHADQARVGYICKNVYNGTDYMPRLIKQYAEDESVTVLVAQLPQHDEPAGLVCGRSHGGCLFLFGLRVAEAARGQGVARQLLEHICQLGAADAGVGTLMSCTIPENAAARALFRRLSFTHHHTVDVFPSWQALRAFEAEAGIVPGGSAPPADHQHLLDALPGVRQLIEQSTAALGVQPRDWVCCDSMQQLQQAVADVRLQQLQRPGMQELPASTPLAWLPGVYEALPLCSHEVTRLLQRGRVWLLPAQQPGGGEQCSAGSSSSSSSSSSSNASGSWATLGGLTASASASSLLSEGSGDAAAAVVAPAGGVGAQPRWRAVVALAPDSPELRRSYACVLTAQDELLAAAVDLVGSKASHFAVFADRGSCHHRAGAGGNTAGELPPLLTATGPPSCYVVVSRPAAGDGGDMSDAAAAAACNN